MAKETRTFALTDTDSGQTFKVDLSQFYYNYGCQIMVTPVRNYGKENEKQFPASHTTVQESESLALTTDDEFKKALEDVIFSVLYPKIKEKITDLYK